jgi:hypothetical protein
VQRAASGERSPDAGVKRGSGPESGRGPHSHTPHSAASPHARVPHSAQTGGAQPARGRGGARPGCAAAGGGLCWCPTFSAHDDALIVYALI